MPTADRQSQQDDAIAACGNMGREPRSGNTVLLFGIVSIALLGIVGITIDISRLAVARSDLQHRLDSALAAGARERTGLRSEAAVEVFDQMPTGAIAKAAVRRFDDDADGLSGVASAAVTTTLSSVLGIRSIRITAKGHAAAPAPHCRDPWMRASDRAGCAITVMSTTETTPQR